MRGKHTVTVYAEVGKVPVDVDVEDVVGNMTEEEVTDLFMKARPDFAQDYRELAMQALMALRRRDHTEAHYLLEKALFPKWKHVFACQKDYEKTMEGRQ
jgi:hypothetical protein